MTNSTTCQCLLAPDAASYQIIKTYEEDSHFSRRLAKCKQCGQLYYKEFSEEIDWIDGDDPQHCVYISVSSESEADMAAENRNWPSGPRYVTDWPKGGEKHAGWVGEAPNRIINVTKIITPYLDSGESNEIPTFTIVMGPVGTGKSRLIKEKYGTGKVLIDAGRLYVDITEGETKPMSDSHAFVLSAGKYLLNEAIRLKKNILIEITSGTIESINLISDKMKNAGYAPNILFIENSIENSWKNNLSRSTNNISAFYSQGETIGIFLEHFLGDWYENALELVKNRIPGDRKGLPGVPAYEHSIRVAELLRYYGYDHETRIAGLLHDIIEDGGTTAEELESMSFSVKTIKLVKLCSHAMDADNKDRRWALMIGQLCEANDSDAWAIKFSDLLDNISESHGLDPKRRQFMIGVKAPLILAVTKELPQLSELRGRLEQVTKSI